MNKLFRKYHRKMALIFSLPLLTTVVSGLLYSIAREWLGQRQVARFLIQVHTLEIFGLEKFFPIINGMGLIGLLVTGVYMTGIFCSRPNLPPTVKD